MLKTIKLLLPALIPSWRFFDVIAPSPRIEFTLLNAPQNTPDIWQEFLPRPLHLSISSMLKQVFWNPLCNERLFLVSCAERLMDTPTGHSAQEIIRRIKTRLEKEISDNKAAPYWQFRLVFVSRQGRELQKHIRFISPVYHCSGNVVS